MQALVSITFDDGFRCQFERALPILNSHRLPATFFLIANQDPTHDRWAGHTNDWWKIDWQGDDVVMLRQVIQQGHEIGSHSVTHHPTKMLMQPELETRHSKQLIEEWVGVTVSSFSYPFYRSHAYLSAAAKTSGYKQARGGGIPPNYGPQASFFAIHRDPKLDLFNVDCRQISNNDSVSDWVRPGCWHILTYHGIGSERDGWAPIPRVQFGAQMAELSELRDSGAVDVVTFATGTLRLRLR